MLYDGSPFARNGKILFDYAEKERFTHFGTSAKFIDACAKRGLRPRETHDLAALRMIALDRLAARRRELRLRLRRGEGATSASSSISGGTDIMGAFADASAVLPVYRGEMQCRSLGMAVEVFDEDGNPVVGPERRARLHQALSLDAARLLERPRRRALPRRVLRQYPNVWCHGDWSELTERGTMIVYGRSDATLNPGGVRIGTAEIYRVVERIDEVEESVAIGQLWPPDKPTDTRVVLFVKLRAGLRARRAARGAHPRRDPAARLAAPRAGAHRRRCRTSRAPRTARWSSSR